MKMTYEAYENEICVLGETVLQAASFVEVYVKSYLQKGDSK